MDADAFLTWIDAYERAWRSPGTDQLAGLFATDTTYLQSPYAEPVEGLPAIARMWEEERDGPDEQFAMTREVVSITGDRGVARVVVRYGDPPREYTDLWVVRFADDGRAVHFEEWPFWPGHGRSPGQGEPVVRDASSVRTDDYAEWARSGALSAGVYRLAAGATDDQSPHAEDEVYVVTSGAAVLDVAGRPQPMRAGSVAYVPARVEHRFVDISADLEVVVVFAPAETE